MKKLAVMMSLAALACGLAGTAEARPGRGHAYGHFKHQNVFRHAVPHRGYYAGPPFRRRHSGNAGAALAAGVTGAIVGGALGAATHPAYRYYDAPPAYGYYGDGYYGY